MNFQGKEEVEIAGLKPVGLGSREEVNLRSIPSPGRNYRVEVLQDKRRWH